MRLNEYQTKQLYMRYGIPVPRGRVASSSREVQQITEELGGQVVIKAQVLVHGRGKLGGIQVARSTQEAEKRSMQILGMLLHNSPVDKVLVDELISFDVQYYISIAIDQTAGQPRLTAYTLVNINNGNGVSQNDPFEFLIDPLFGLLEFQIRDIALHLDLPREHWTQFKQAVQGLWNIYWECDALKVESNPLVISNDNGLIVLDGEVELDDKALFRHLELAEMRDLISEDSIQKEARKYGFNFVPLNGNIGTVSNGAGLAMATVDTIHLFGGHPANYLDTGPCHTPGLATLAFKLALNVPDVSILFVNIFGGISNCLQVAQDLIQVIDEIEPVTPIVLRLSGEGAEEAQLLLSTINVEVFNNFEKAIRHVIKKANMISEAGNYERVH